MQAGDAPVDIGLAKGREKRASANSRFVDLKFFSHLIGLLEDDLEIIGRARVGRSANVCGGSHLKLGLAGACGKDGGSYGRSTAFKHHARRCEMIGKAVLHRVLGTDSGGVEETGHAPCIWRTRARLVDRARRLKDMGDVIGVDPSKWGILFLPLGEVGFAQDWQICEVCEACDVRVRDPASIRC